MKNMDLMGKVVVRLCDYELFKVVGYDDERNSYIVRHDSHWYMYTAVLDDMFETAYSDDLEKIYAEVEEKIKRLKTIKKVYLKYNFNLERKVDAYKEVYSQLKYFDEFSECYNPEHLKRMVRELNKGKRRIEKVFHRYVRDEEDYELFIEYCNKKGHIYGTKTEEEILEKLGKVLGK